MKRFLRLVVFAGLVGGWTLSAASLNVVRAPGKVLIFPKDRISFHDTYVDTRDWTLADVRQHPVVSARLIHLGRENLLFQAVDPLKGPPEVQLTDALNHAEPAPPTTAPAFVQKVATNIHDAGKKLMSVFD